MSERVEEFFNVLSPPTSETIQLLFSLILCLAIRFGIHIINFHEYELTIYVQIRFTINNIDHVVHIFF